MTKGNGPTFKTLVSDFNPYHDFDHTSTEAEVLQESRKLLKAWRGGGPRGGGVGEVWGGGRGPMRVTMPTHREALAMIVYHLARGQGGVLLYGGSCTRSVPAMAACLLMLLSKGSLRFEECYELCIALRPACARYKVSEAATLMSPIFEHWDTVTATPSGQKLARCLRDCHVPALVLPQTFVDGVQDGEKWDQELTPLQHGVVPLTEEQDCEKVPRIAWAQLFPMDYPMNYTAWERLYERQGRPRTIWLDMMNVAAQEEDQPPAAQHQPPPASGCTRSSTQQHAAAAAAAAVPGGGGGGDILPWSAPPPRGPPPGQAATVSGNGELQDANADGIAVVIVTHRAALRARAVCEGHGDGAAAAAAAAAAARAGRGMCAEQRHGPTQGAGAGTMAGARCWCHLGGEAAVWPSSTARGAAGTAAAGKVTEPYEPAVAPHPGPRHSSV